MSAMSHKSWKTTSGRTMLLLVMVELLPTLLAPLLCFELEYTFSRPWCPQVPSQTCLALSFTTLASWPRPRLKR